jgi:hypothetical protein
MSKRCVPAFSQRLLPRGIRIEPGPLRCLPVSPATAFALSLDAQQAAPEPVAAAPGPAEQLSEGVAVELCNSLHRIGLGIRDLRAVDGTAAATRSMGLALEQLRQRLKADGVEFTDLTGHPWQPDRQDFECTGQPRAKLGIDTAVIESCECPAVTVRGELVQKARGTAVRPPQTVDDE